MQDMLIVEPRPAAYTTKLSRFDAYERQAASAQQVIRLNRAFVVDEHKIFAIDEQEVQRINQRITAHTWHCDVLQIVKPLTINVANG
jgi:hypothetical protein